MSDVVIRDVRKKWMKKEDRYMVCYWYCRSFDQCKSRFGDRCKRFGGPMIPKFLENKGRDNRGSNGMAAQGH